MNALDEKTREVMTASYALPDLETAVQQGEVNLIHSNDVEVLTWSLDEQ